MMMMDIRGSHVTDQAPPPHTLGFSPYPAKVFDNRLSHASNLEVQQLMLAVCQTTGELNTIYRNCKIVSKLLMIFIDSLMIFNVW